ncbi:adenosylcobinamide-phosphate synthase [Pelagivirga sediminicola]|uniref:Cobalamin biosynthesis protein CobD n=1 Tax=Pelagivirga sediminicola TaxID=2170575 RepID=A0A2T7G8Z1_9RHOB|nr:adenosylcobinamide-phosphate synthase CbiB [Pelagivirga sediminicola]PVA10894.1 adenosylcobinamide-phosphate synthase [Pelagivirga sediminicola]
MSMASILVLAMALDAALGEPRWLWDRLPHPAVVMGRAIDLLDRRWNTGKARRAKGALAIALLGAAALMLGAALAQLGAAVVIIVAAVLIAQRSLCDHVAAVAAALRLSLPDGRASVAMIVGRETQAMDGPAVSRAAIESAAENFSDGVAAPLFWLAIGGLPGLILYKIVNTADSMIGHRTPRHAQFGWAAARLDDLMNLIPARATALLILLLSYPRPRWSDIVREARQHRSPNAGWPEAAMARSIGVALSGPRAYHGQMHSYPFVNPEGRRNPGPDDIDAAVAVLWRLWAAILLLSVLWALLG